jgi:hypothetical protein
MLFLANGIFPKTLTESSKSPFRLKIGQGIISKQECFTHSVFAWILMNKGYMVKERIYLVSPKKVKDILLKVS